MTDEEAAALSNEAAMLPASYVNRFWLQVVEAQGIRLSFAEATHGLVLGRSAVIMSLETALALRKLLDQYVIEMPTRMVN